MKISVVITAYNEEAYLPSCLEALGAQDFPKENFEIIVVDNNSTDKTAEIAKDFGARVIEEKRQGYVFGLNTGMYAAGNEIIAVTDADTIVAQDWLTEINRAFGNEKVVAVTGLNDKSFQLRILSPFVSLLSHSLLKLTFALGKPNLCGFNFAVRREIFHQIGGLDLRFKMSPDVDLGMRLTKLGQVKYVPSMRVTTSPRRWQDNPLKTFIEYTKGYVSATILRRPPSVKQKVIR